MWDERIFFMKKKKEDSIEGLKTKDVFFTIDIIQWLNVEPWNALSSTIAMWTSNIFLEMKIKDRQQSSLTTTFDL